MYTYINSLCTNIKILLVSQNKMYAWKSWNFFTLSQHSHIVEITLSLLRIFGKNLVKLTLLL